jgi:hypothetical protein
MGSANDVFLDIHYTPVTSDVEGCAGLLRTDLEITGQNGLVETVALNAGVPDRGFIRSWDATLEKRHVKFVLNQAMMDDGASDLSDFLVAGETDIWTVPMKFAHYKTPVQVGDDPLFTEDVSVTFRKQTMAEKCDISALTVTTQVPDQAYEVTKDNLPKTAFTKTVASSQLAECNVSVALQTLQADGSWATYDENTPASAPWIATFDGATMAASIGFDWGAIPYSDLAAWQPDQTEQAWLITMRYHTVIEQAHPTDKGSFSDEFVVKIVEKAYDPCNDSTLTLSGDQQPIAYAWSPLWTDGEGFQDVQPSTFDNPTAACATSTGFRVQDPTSQEWTTVTHDNREEYPFVANVASSGLVTIFSVPDHTENDYMTKYASGDDLVINAQWQHCEDTWVESDADCVTDDFTITFSYPLGDVCA